MGNLLGLGGNSGSSAFGYGPETQCCEAVVDPITLLVSIGAIAGVSLFLRQAVIDFMVMMAGRKKRALGIQDTVEYSMLQGNVIDLILRCQLNN